MSKILIHIDRLILEGIDPRSQSDFVDSLQQHLQSLLANQTSFDAIRQAADIKKLQIESHALGAGNNAKSQGVEIANNIASGLMVNPSGSAAAKGKQT